MYWDFNLEIICLSPIIRHDCGEVINSLSFGILLFFVYFRNGHCCGLSCRCGGRPCIFLQNFVYCRMIPVLFSPLVLWSLQDPGLFQDQIPGICNPSCFPPAIFVLFILDVQLSLTDFQWTFFLLRQYQTLSLHFLLLAFFPYIPTIVIFLF